jgi:basic amino acid/polyamine antiporter, APA family
MKTKKLSFPLLISLVIGNMIGTGIYVLPAALAKYGTISLLSWVYTSIGAIMLALTFARLSKRFPQTGGPYVYCREAFGKLAGFIVSYTYWAGNLVSIAGIAVSSVGYLGFLIPALNGNTHTYDPNLALIIEIGFVWAFTLINLIGLHTAGVFQLVLTIIKIAPLLLITLVGFGHIHLANLMQFTNGQESTFISMSGAAALTFWAFLGLESATIPAENTNGSRDIFNATVYGTILTCIIYIASTFVLMGMISTTELQNSPFPFSAACCVRSDRGFRRAECLYSGAGTNLLCSST